MSNLQAGGPVLPGCVPDCECAHVYGAEHVMQGPGGRLVIAAVALRPGDAYLVVRPGRIVEALITDLWVPRRLRCCRAGERVIAGRRDTFWIEAGWVVVTRRDPAYEGWTPELRDAPQPPAPDDAFDFSVWRLLGRFARRRDPRTGEWKVYGQPRCTETGTRELPGGGYDWAAHHAESRHDDGNGWDTPHYRGPWGAPKDQQPFSMPWVNRARTACMATDLGLDDPVRRAPGDPFNPPGYTCRLGHVHFGEPPDFAQLPPEVAARISASLGDEPPGNPRETT